MGLGRLPSNRFGPWLCYETFISFVARPNSKTEAAFVRLSSSMDFVTMTTGYAIF